MPAERWSLYVDESGSFGRETARPTKVSAVVGLLLRDHETQAASEMLRAELEAIWAPVPWPPHRAYLEAPVALALASLLPRAPHAPAVPAPDAALIARCGTALAAAAPDAEARYREGSLEPKDLWTLDAGIFRRAISRRDHARLQQCLWMRHAGTQDLLRRLRERCGGAFHVVAACIAEPYPPPETVGEGAVVRDAWVRTLEALLERVYALLCDSSREAPRLTLRVLTRRLSRGPRRRDARLREEQPSILLKSRSHLDREAIAEIAARASGLPRLGKAVRVEPTAHPNHFDADVHPMLVLADHVAFAVRQSANYRAGLATVNLLIDKALGGTGWTEVPPRSGTMSPVPGLAADGAARAAILRALARLGEDGPAVDPAWPRDQADLWIEAAAKGVAS